MDLWKPGVKSRGGNKYVLTLIDGFSKFVQTSAVPNKKAESIAKSLLNFITIFGVPNRIHSDLGREFMNEVLKALFALMGSTQSKTTAYHPQGNAYAERIHKFFRQAIASYYQDDHRIWDEYLPFLVMCYNDSYHSALGCTPAEVMFGRRMNISPLPITTAEKKEYTTLGYVARLEYILAKTHSLIFDKINEKKLKHSLEAEGRQPTAFQPGDLVLLYRPQISVAETSMKLAVHWFGPYTVDKILSNGKVYYLKDHLGDPLKYPVSVKLLRKYEHRPGEELQYEPFPDSLLSEPIYNPVSDSQYEKEHDDDSSAEEYVPSKKKAKKALQVDPAIVAEKRAMLCPTRARKLAQSTYVTDKKKVTSKKKY